MNPLGKLAVVALTLCSAILATNGVQAPVPGRLAQAKPEDIKTRTHFLKHSHGQRRLEVTDDQDGMSTKSADRVSQDAAQGEGAGGSISASAENVLNNDWKKPQTSVNETSRNTKSKDQDTDSSSQSTSTDQDQPPPKPSSMKAAASQPGTATAGNMTDIDNAEDTKASIVALRIRKRVLSKSLHQLRQQQAKAVDSLQHALGRRDELAALAQNASDARRDLEGALSDLRTKGPLFQHAINTLAQKARKSRSELMKLERRRKWLIERRQALVDDFRRRGLEHWIESSLRASSVAPFVRNAAIGAATKIVEPFIGGIERIVEVNDHVSSEMTSRLKTTVSMTEVTFFAGFVSYAVLLIPLVLVISVLLRLKRGLSQVTPIHFIFLANLYFWLLSFGALCANLGASVDVLDTLRNANRTVYHAVLVMHAFVYSLYSMLQAETARRERTVRTVRVAVFVVCIGLHFLMHFAQSAVRRDHPHIDTPVYFIYTLMFATVVVDTARARQRRMKGQTTKRLSNNDDVGVTGNSKAINSELPIVVSRSTELNHRSKQATKDPFDLPQDVHTPRVDEEFDGCTNPLYRVVDDTGLDMHCSAAVTIQGVSDKDE